MKTYVVTPHLNRLKKKCFNANAQANADADIRPRGHKKKIFMLNSAKHEIFPTHKNVEMPTIVGISTFMSWKNSILCLSEP